MAGAIILNPNEKRIDTNVARHTYICGGDRKFMGRFLKFSSIQWSEWIVRKGCELFHQKASGGGKYVNIYKNFGKTVVFLKNFLWSFMHAFPGFAWNGFFFYRMFYKIFFRKLLKAQAEENIFCIQAMELNRVGKQSACHVCWRNRPFVKVLSIFIQLATRACFSAGVIFK